MVVPFLVISVSQGAHSHGADLHVGLPAVVEECHMCFPNLKFLEQGKATKVNIHYVRLQI